LRSTLWRCPEYGRERGGASMSHPQPRSSSFPLHTHPSRTPSRGRRTLGRSGGIVSASCSSRIMGGRSIAVIWATRSRWARRTGICRVILTITGSRRRLRSAGLRGWSFVRLVGVGGWCLYGIWYFLRGVLACVSCSFISFSQASPPSLPACLPPSPGDLRLFLYS